MRETGIIMSGNHPKLILDGIKTMTRRVAKPFKTQNPHSSLSVHGRIGSIADMGAEIRYYNKYGPNPLSCPYGQVGDRLWVRETWAAQFIYDYYPPRDIPIDSVVFYRTNDRLKLEIAKEHRDLGKWRPSIHIPRWASRITLEITDIRVERLQDISPEDCIAEGINLSTDPFPTINTPDKFRSRFKKLWNSLNAKWKPVWNKEFRYYEYWQFPWAAEDAKPIPKTTQHPERYHCVPNPWLWVISFMRLK